jgi:hypothetical protein
MSEILSILRSELRNDAAGKTKPMMVRLEPKHQPDFSSISVL